MPDNESSRSQPTTAEDIQKEIPDATEKEVTTLPFCLIANDILHITGYTKFTRSLFPTPRPTKLQALEINVPSLYQMLTSEPNALSIADFNNKKIDSIEYAQSNKDAVFCSAFDMAQIKKNCESYKLTFAQSIRILPGMKACKVLSSKPVKKIGGAAEKGSTSYISHILNNPVVIEESKKDLSDLKQPVDTLQNEINNLKEELPYIKTVKVKLKDDNSNNDLITRLKDTKKKRQEAYQAIQVCRPSKATFNEELYYKMNAIRYKSQLDKKREEKSTGSAKEEKESVCILIGETRGVYKAEECRLSEVDNFFSFSGTDNGIINMSTTTQFTLDRFKLHLELYNRYQVLGEVDIDIQDHRKYLDLPQQNQVIILQVLMWVAPTVRSGRN
ncbi:hypothetical protein HPULCUR_004535 [Helicostylum pulchrum]|uniref:Uncharacterized protein n=1 Tax=Helicostylum pulchrum TaxID=562976 RepID=A0ABP9XWH9_9FUNG